MALGGGLWNAQNKILPGSYINFSSAARADSALSARGIVALPIPLDWGESGKVYEIKPRDFATKSNEIFGYNSGDAKLLPIREVFKNASTVLIYRLAASDAAVAENTYATAKYAGARGNDLTIKIEANGNDFDVYTYLGAEKVDKQTVAAASALEANAFVAFKTGATLAVTAGTPLAGGSNGGSLAGTEYQAALDAFEAYSFNVICCPTADATTIALFAAWNRRLRDEVGAKTQLVAYQYANADYEGVISVENSVSGYGAGVGGMGAHGLVYWTAGAAASCAANASNTNKLYDGELTVDVDYTQLELEDALLAGKFIFHNVNGAVRVLADINTLTTYTETKGKDFSSNQTIRVIDQIANDAAVIFNTQFLGRVPNDADGRISLWNEICKLYQALQSQRAIEDFDSGIVTVTAGDAKNSVVVSTDGILITNAMEKLYMSVVIA